MDGETLASSKALQMIRRLRTLSSMPTMTKEEQAAYDEALKRIEECRRRGEEGNSIDLSNLGLVNLPPEIGQLTALRLLNLDDNQLNELPSEINQLKRLKQFNLSHNLLSALPLPVCKLGALRQLSLESNRLETLPPEIGKLQALAQLNLYNNQLISLPAEIGRLRELYHLSLENNKLTLLPGELGQLKKLNKLYLHNNRLKRLPLEIGQLTRLEQLNLYNNQLDMLPPEFGQLTALHRLNLSLNPLSNLPPEFGRLESLRYLYLHDCQLDRVPREITNLVFMIELRLDNNRLSELSQEIGQLTELKKLRLDGNYLEALPSEFIKLNKLKEIDLSNNKLRAIPSEFGNFASLRRLNLSRNEVSTVPPELGELVMLTLLDLSDNHLTKLPREFQQLKKLSQLYLHNNPHLDLSSVVLGPTYKDVYENRVQPASPHAILDYYFGRLAQGEAPMQEVRVLLVGRGRVGKTSLLKALHGEKPDTHEKETPGITVMPLDLKCGQGTARGHTWDFGGQEFLHGTHQIFLSERCVYVLVLEGRESNWELETDYWLRFIQSFGGNSPVVVALNKYDLHPFSVDRFRLQERCPQIVGFVETDAFTGLGIAALRSLLEHTVNGMDHVWAGVPKKWHRVKEELTQMPESFLEYRDYQALCARLGVTEEQQQDSLAEVLHRLGIALNFRDHHRLRHTSVLKPQWVTEGIYGLLRFAQKKDCHGVLERKWLGEALPAKDYPPEKHGFVLELMEKFEVAFALETPERGAGTPAEPTRWLIPELLREVQPAAFEEFRQPGVKRLRFTYPEALPPGLLPRLIVRTHEMSEGHADWRWRSGVVLEWAGCRALVRLDRQQRRTDVAVIGGTEEGRQSLFDIIRYHLTVLHGKVPVVEEVQAMDDPEKWVEMRELRMAERDKDEELKVTVGKEPDVKRVKLQVVETLNTVESEAARKAAGPDAEQRMQLFISYAHANEKELLPFRQHLTHLSQQGYIQVWNDRDLVAGEQWETGIMEALKRADIVLLFYTTAARVSKFIQEKELMISLDRSDAGDCTLIWVPLERKDLDEKHPLEKRLKALQCATQDAQPIYDFEREAKGWMQVEQSIRKAVEKRRKRIP